MMNTPLDRLRVIAHIEGISYLSLLGIAMPLKYMAHVESAVTVAGWLHGVLFILYVFALVDAMFSVRWPMRRGLLMFIASVIPFGNFYVDASVRRELAYETARNDSTN